MGGERSGRQGRETLPTWASTSMQARDAEESKRGMLSGGGPCRDRTDDIHGVNVALYQLS